MLLRSEILSYLGVDSRENAPLKKYVLEQLKNSSDHSSIPFPTIERDWSSFGSHSDFFESFRQDMKKYFGDSIFDSNTDSLPDNYQGSFKSTMKIKSSSDPADPQEPQEPQERQYTRVTQSKDDEVLSTEIDTSADSNEGGSIKRTLERKLSWTKEEFDSVDSEKPALGDFILHAWLSRPALPLMEEFLTPHQSSFHFLKHMNGQHEPLGVALSHSSFFRGETESVRPYKRRPYVVKKFDENLNICAKLRDLRPSKLTFDFFSDVQNVFHFNMNGIPLNQTGFWESDENLIETKSLFESDNNPVSNWFLLMWTLPIDCDIEFRFNWCDLSADVMFEFSSSNIDYKINLWGFMQEMERLRLASSEHRKIEFTFNDPKSLLVANQPVEYPTKIEHPSKINNQEDLVISFLDKEVAPFYTADSLLYRNVQYVLVDDLTKLTVLDYLFEYQKCEGTEPTLEEVFHMIKADLEKVPSTDESNKEIIEETGKQHPHYYRRTYFSQNKWAKVQAEDTSGFVTDCYNYINKRDESYFRAWIDNSSIQSTSE